MILGLLLAGVVKGLTGIGYTTCALPFLVASVGLKPAMAIVIVPAISSNIAIILGNRKLGLVASRFWPFYASIIPGIALGTLALVKIDPIIPTRVLGSIIVGYVIIAGFGPGLHIVQAVERVLLVPAGFLNGFLTGLTGSQIFPMMPLFLALRLSPEHQVQATNIAVALASVASALVLFRAGIMTIDYFGASVLGVIPALTGTFAGNKLRSILNPKIFRTLTLCVLAVMGFAMMG